MSIEESIYTVLSGVAAATGGAFPNVSPDKELRPHVVYQSIFGDDHETLAGPGGLFARRVQFTCWAKSRILARDLRDAVKIAIRSSVLFDSVIYLGLNPDLWDADTKMYGESFDFSIYHT